MLGLRVLVTSLTMYQISHVRLGVTLIRKLFAARKYNENMHFLARTAVLLTVFSVGKSPLCKFSAQIDRPMTFYRIPISEAARSPAQRCCNTCNDDRQMGKRKFRPPVDLKP